MEGLIQPMIFLPQGKMEESIFHKENVLKRETRTAREGYADSKSQHRGGVLIFVLDLQV